MFLPFTLFFGNMFKHTLAMIRGQENVLVENYAHPEVGSHLLASQTQKETESTPNTQGPTPPQEYRSC